MQNSRVCRHLLCLPRGLLLSFITQGVVAFSQNSFAIRQMFTYKDYFLNCDIKKNLRGKIFKVFKHSHTDNRKFTNPIVILMSIPISDTVAGVAWHLGNNAGHVIAHRRVRKFRGALFHDSPSRMGTHVHTRTAVILISYSNLKLNWSTAVLTTKRYKHSIYVYGDIGNSIDNNTSHSIKQSRFILVM